METKRGESRDITRATLYLPRDLMEWMKAHHREANARNVNEFIVTAILFYSGYVSSGKAEDYLLTTVSSFMDARLDASNSRTDGMLFKLAVEVAMQNRILAKAIRIDEEEVTEIREKALDDIRRIWR